MWLYIGIGVGVLLATVVFHIVIWNVFFKPRLQKQAQLLEQQALAQQGQQLAQQGQRLTQLASE